MGEAAVNATPPVNVLRNIGVPVKVYVLATGEDGTLVRPVQRVQEEATGEFAVEWRYVKVTNRVIADMEQPAPYGWGSVTGWERDLDERPMSALARTLALCWGLVDAGEPDWRTVSEMLLDGQQDAYAVALGAAYLLAQGVSADVAGEQLRVGIASLIDTRDIMNSVVSQKVGAEMETIKKALEEAKTLLEQLADESPSDGSGSDGTTPTSPSPSGPEPGSEDSSGSGSELVAATTSSGT